jgi:hypothetical protein
MPITLEYGKCITVDKGGEGVLFFKNLVSLVSETGKARGCYANTSVIQSFIH